MTRMTPSGTWKNASGHKAPTVRVTRPQKGAVFVLPYPAGILQGDALWREKDVAQRWRSVEISERYLSRQNDIAVLAYRVSAERSDEPIYEALCTSTYLNDDGKWLRLAHTSKRRLIRRATNEPEGGIVWFAPILSNTAQQTRDRIFLRPHEPPPCFDGYVVAHLEIGDQSHRNAFGILTFSLPLALLRRVQQLLDFEFLGQCACFGHDAGGHSGCHVDECLARTIGERFVLTFEAAQLAFRKGLLDLLLHEALKGLRHVLFPPFHQIRVRILTIARQPHSPVKKWRHSKSCAVRQLWSALHTRPQDTSH
jgi:hypothetical protein